MIRRLSPEVVNQIAAGEVVERPASVAKELLENALDAGGRRLLVEIQGGGAELVRVTDDGDGFEPDDLPLAFASHATSKLKSVGDLEHIGSLGFRGEALASIGAVARASIKSRRRGHDEGRWLRCEGGHEQPVQPCASQVGTQVEVRDLFFNVPARRRFLKSPAAEKAKVQEVVCELSLARLDVDFTFLADGREVLRLPAGEALGQRFARCFGSELQRSLLPVERSFGDLHVTGLCGEPDLARRDGRLELFFVNGRRASDRSALFAVRQAYREFLMGGRFPIYVLQVQLPPDQVDVNVHPRKAEVRFLDQRRVAGCLHETVRAALLARGGAVAGGGVVVAEDLPRARSGFPELPRDLFGRAVPPATPFPPGATARDLPWQVREPGPGGPAVPARAEDQCAATGSPAQAGSAVPLAPASRPNPFRAATGRFLQVLDLYVLLSTDDGVLVVDQHALHERVVYERLRAAHLARAVQVQRLLVPALVELAPAELEFVLDAAPELAAEGFLLEEFGPGTIAVQGIPAVIAKADPVALVRALVQQEGDEAARPRARAQIVERFHSMACRAAVMSGDRLGDAEIAALLQAAAALEHPHNCPHGRPTVLTFTAAELERYFRRRC